MARSWKQELDTRYRKCMNSGDKAIMDAANEVITEASAKLDAVLRKERSRVHAL